MHHFNNLHLTFENKNTNLGLFYHKFAPEFKKDNADAKKNFLLEFSQLTPNTAHLKKRIHFLENYADASIPLRAESRFLVGVGNVNTTEWGLSFDWTTGAPYLPGSSFKGALLSYLEFCREKPEPVECWKEGVYVNLENGDKWDKEDILHLFGPQESKGFPVKEKKTGEVIFFDVYPQKFNGFELDVITPHFGSYYKDPKKYPPADIYNPVPTHFLTVKPGSEFLFMFKLRTVKNETLQQKIKALIIETGQNYGFGAKTSSGYGYFKIVHNKSSFLNNKEKKLSPGKNNDKNISIVEAVPLPIADDRNVQRKLIGIKNQYNQACWKKIAQSGFIKKVTGEGFTARIPDFSLPFIKILDNGKKLKIIYKNGQFICTVSIELKGINNKSESKYVWNHIIKAMLEN